MVSSKIRVGQSPTRTKSNDQIGSRAKILNSSKNSESSKTKKIPTDDNTKQKSEQIEIPEQTDTTKWIGKST